MSTPTMKLRGRYNWKGQPERLVYIGHNWSGNGRWHQFEKVDQPGKVWCEVLTSDLHMLEETPIGDPLVSSLEAIESLMAGSERGLDGKWDRICMPKEAAMHLGANAADALRRAISEPPAGQAATDQHIKWLHETLREAGHCIDGGKCHHRCNPGPCFRQNGCVPLTGSALQNDWTLPRIKEGGADA